MSDNVNDDDTSISINTQFKIVQLIKGQENEKLFKTIEVVLTRVF